MKTTFRANQLLERRSGIQVSALMAALALVFSLVLSALPAAAQTAGEAAITGTVTDSTGAVVANASVTATNVATGVSTERKTSSAGVYEVSPLIAGTYTVNVSVAGFESFVQDDIELHENQVFGLNPVMKVGNAKQTVTVTAAPPELDTANAVLGGTIEDQEFMKLPILVAGNQQRDITQFSNYLPGSQAGSRSSLFSGTASRVEEVYLDGIPLTTISQIGDNRPIFNLVPSEGIGEVGALTSGQSVEYQGAGSVNYNMRSGGNQYHGTVADFVRNTIFDTWGFSAPAATQKALVNGVITTVPVGKPVDHQNEFTFAVGGPVKFPHLYNGHDKLFFFAAYDKVHTRSAPAYAAQTIPTTKMQGGDFSELLAANGGPGYTVYDPTTLGACSAVSTTGPCRYAYGQSYGGTPGPAGDPTGTVTNVIPAGELSPIAQKMESFLPAPTTSGIQNNYLGGIPSGYDNWLYSGRIDYTVSPKQTIAMTVTGGNRHAVPYTSTANVIPAPYLGTTASIVAGHWADFSDSYTFRPNLVNQFKYGFSNFGGPPIKNITQGVTDWEAGTSSGLGIQFTGVPANGQAVTEFPTNVFAGSNAQSEWGEGGSGVTATTVSETYTAVDNLLWIKGKHAMTFGVQFQWLEENASSYDGPTSSLTLNWSTNETAGINGTSYGSNTGYSYASFMLGAVGSTGITLQPFSVLGGRYRPIAPYFADDYKITPKLTLNLGLRWDFIPTYNEVLNRFSYLNPNITNPVTGNNGALEFAGTWGGSAVSCNCGSPVSNHMGNWGPRLGFAYAINSKTTVRGAYSLVYSHAGGTGGAGGAYAGPSQLGFTSSPSYTDFGAGASAGPAFYLNTSTTFTSLGLANNNFGGPGYTVPPITAPGAVSQTLNVGNTVNSSGAFVTASGAPGFPDFYLSGRAPEFDFWNFGVERQLSENIAVALNYAGSESHFLAGASNMRGLQSGQLNPKWWAAAQYGAANGLGNVLTAPATAAGIANFNTAATGAGLPTITAPYANFSAAAATSAGAGKATVQQSLLWMPQFSGTSDTWGNVANVSYHAFQLSLNKRISNGMSFTVNYTYSKQLDDTGTMRSGYAIPASVMANNKGWPVDRIDRSWSTNSVPQSLAVFGTYDLPFGKGKIGSDSMLVRAIAGDWTLSGLGTYYSGTPLSVTSTACSGSFNPGAGQCMPNLNPSFTGHTIRQNGSWGKGMTATTLGKAPSSGGIAYMLGSLSGNTTSSSANYNTGNFTTSGSGSSLVINNIPCSNPAYPYCDVNAFQIGDAPRENASWLRGPGTPNVNLGLRRAFPLGSERLNFVFAVDCQNITNKVTFGGISTAIDSTAFGTVSSATSNTGSRDFQFSGRFNF
jgi:Carboxypeptidase regulatory-like domain